MKNLPKINLV
jgi:hypothetical protein